MDIQSDIDVSAARQERSRDEIERSVQEALKNSERHRQWSNYYQILSHAILFLEDIRTNNGETAEPGELAR
jgi:hypothetical protein